MYKPAKKTFLVASLSVVIIFISSILIKTLFPYWATLPIVALVSVVIAVMLRKQGQKLSTKLTSVTLLVVMLISLIMVSITEGMITSTVCTLRDWTAVRDLSLIAPNTSATICGYIDGCVWQQTGQQQHDWEICLLIDTLDSSKSVLLYNLDVTAAGDNRFAFFTSMVKVPRGTLVDAPIIEWNYISQQQCSITEFCTTAPPPFAEIYSARVK